MVQCSKSFTINRNSKVHYTAHNNSLYAIVAGGITLNTITLISFITIVDSRTMNITTA
jgi:hypothetical protein